MEEFKAEAKIMASLRPSVNVVLFLGVCLPTPQTPLCILSEFCDNGSLDNFLKKYRGVISNNMKLRIVLGVAKGMYHISRERIIHKDLAARNVFLSKSYDVKVGDFGLAKLMGTESGAAVGPIKW